VVVTSSPLRWLTNKSLLLAVIVVWSVLMLALGYKVGVQHDYGYYLMHWDLVREGLNPWTHNDSFPPNTYGPAYNVLAYLAPIHTLLPKLLMIAAFLAANIFFALKLVRSNPELSQTLLYFILVPLNFLVISVVALFGDNDTLVAALVAFAVLARFKNQLVVAGILLGVAVLLKYYPALLIPFFCLNDRRFNWRIVISAAITTSIGGITAWLIWGSDFLFSLSFGATREATYLSPLFALKNHPEVAPAALVDFLTNNNTAFVLILAAITFILTYKLKFTWLEASATGLFVCLVAYKVGHAQYYLAWLVLLVGLVIQGDRRSKNLVYAFLPFVVLLESFQFTYFIRMNGYWETELGIDQNVGTAVFVIVVITLLYIFLSKMRKNHEQLPQSNRGHFDQE
jgi:Glycosyltransferase family 87